jgi:hypothetical protein
MRSATIADGLADPHPRDAGTIGHARRTLITGGTSAVIEVMTVAGHP